MTRRARLRRPLEPIRYTVSFPAPHTHYVEIEASYPTEGRPSIDLMMAVWTPGSYLIREYARHVEALTAADPARAPLRRRENAQEPVAHHDEWRRTVWVRYRVYAHEMSVRTNWVDEEFALINGAPTFITLVESPSRRPHEVRVVLPRAWTRSLSGMTAGLGENTYVAPDYDTLVDSPIVAGSPSVYEFSVRGQAALPRELPRAWGVERTAGGCGISRKSPRPSRSSGETCLSIDSISSTSSDRAQNGLEHKNSTVLNIPLESTSSREGYLDWLSLASHEYFHAWNVKRLRPVELGPFDYENEVYTKSALVRRRAHRLLRRPVPGARRRRDAR